LPPLPLAWEAALLFGEDWGPGSLVVDLLEASGTTEVEVGPWLHDDEVHPALAEGSKRAAGTRVVTMRVPLAPAPMTPKTTRTTSTYSLSRKDEDTGVSICIDTSIVIHDIPYADYFTVQERITLTLQQDGIAVKKMAGLRFSKSTFVQSVIESNFKGSQRKSGEELLTFLRRRATPAPTAEGAGIVTSQRASKTCVVELWELQRRPTLFHTTWTAPFLPMDSTELWRWVDKSMERHPWITCGRPGAAAADLPPVDAPARWEQDVGGWSVAQTQAPEQCDEGGWQYAVDFYKNDAWWIANPVLCVCRRRLWRCTFRERGRPLGEELEGEQASAGPCADRLAVVAHGVVPPLRLAAEAERLQAEDWAPGSLVLDLLAATGATEIKAATSHTISSGGSGGDAKVRRVEARAAPYLGKDTRSTADYHVYTRGEKEAMSLYIEAKVVLHDIPFCEHLELQERLALESMPNGSVLVVKEFGHGFSGSALAQTCTEAMLRRWQQRAGDQLLDFLRQRATGASSTAPQPRVVEVWELQRRLTLFHVTWTAPFLPHDGEKQWRWVDTKYRKHPWALGAQVSSAASDVPPLRPPIGWASEEAEEAEWAVTRTLEPCDEEGWQYAADFYESDRLWNSTAAFCHCRRRLWRRPLSAREDCRAIPQERPTEAPQRSGRQWRSLGALICLLVLCAFLLAFGAPAKLAVDPAQQEHSSTSYVGWLKASVFPGSWRARDGLQCDLADGRDEHTAGSCGGA
jgi:hypothetical protein